MSQADRTRQQSRMPVPQCLLSSANPKAFGKKVANALAKTLGLAFVAAEELKRTGQSSLYFFSNPLVHAEIRNENRPVLPFGTGGRWLRVSIDLNATGGAKWRVNHISIGLLQGDMVGQKRMILRAEWMMYEQRDTSGHGQPHWHVLTPEAPGNSEDFEDVVAASSGFVGFLAAEAEQGAPAPAHLTSAFDHFHYAMAAEWDAKPSVGPGRVLQDETAAIAWLQGCVGYIVRQLEHVDGKAGAPAVI